MKTSEVLYTAADLIDFHGHATGNGWPGAESFTGRLCLEGGIMAALGMEWEDENGSGLYRMWACPAYAAVKSYLANPEVNPDGVLPFSWQDRLPYGVHLDPPVPGWVGGSEKAARAYAHEQVTSVLRAAAVIEAAKEQAEVREPVTA